MSVPGKPANHKDCLESRIQDQFPQARIVHRLDMSTSGIMVLAMHAGAHRHLGLQFEPYGANGWWYEKRLDIARKLIFSKWQAGFGGNLNALYYELQRRYSDSKYRMSNL